MFGNSTIYTIGCSTHEPASFLANLERHGITVVADVRSTPYSRHTPQFNRELLQAFLKEHHVAYVYLGAEFGARRDEDAAFDDDRVEYEKVFQLEAFHRGVARLQTGLAKDHRIALMCTEKDPLDCHRSLMVTRYLSGELKLPIAHITFEGELESNEALELRMREKAKVHPDLFMQDEAELSRKAYQKLSRRIAYRREAAVL